MPVAPQVYYRSSSNSGSTWRLNFGVDSSVQERVTRRLRERLANAETANRHAVELVERLLTELAAEREEVAYLRPFWQRVILAQCRLIDYRRGDGSRRRQVLADIEEILGS